MCVSFPIVMGSIGRFFVFLGLLVRARAFHINYTEYYGMPKLNAFDDYDRCLTATTEESLFCLVDVQLKPDPGSELWNYIDRFSRDSKHHFRHDRLQRGICVNTCKTTMANLPNRSHDLYYLENIHRLGYREWTFPSVHANVVADRVKYGKIINQCVNHELMGQYNLQAYSTIEYCVSNRDVDSSFDLLDIFSVVVISTICLLVVASTVYDYRMRKSLTYNKLLVAFSVIRNWKRLTGDQSGDGSGEFRFIHALRFGTMVGVIASHAILSFTQPVDNPEYVEAAYHGLPLKILLGGMVLNQVFFGISGFLQSALFFDHAKKNGQIGWNLLWQSTLHRYVRLVPVYSLMILLDATLLVKIQDGPMWSRLAETERHFCRKNWWTNMLFINNYMNANEPCMQQCWYLAVDFQLFILGMVMLLAIWKFPKYKAVIMGIPLVAAWVIPALVTYVNEFEAVTLFEPEALKFGLCFDINYFRMYIPTHTNLGSFLGALLTGWLYHRMQSENVDLRKNRLLRAAWHAIVPVGFAIVMGVELFYANNFTRPSLWMAAYSSFNKNVWGLLAIVFFLGLTQRIGFLIRDLFEMDIFRALGRLTYSAYICHWFVLRCLIGYNRYPVHLSGMTFLKMCASGVVVSYFFALCLSLAVELPTTALQKSLRKEIKVESAPSAPV